MSSFDPSNPNSMRGTAVDEYFGTKVPDPYQWLEDPDGEDTVKWVEAQNKKTAEYYKNISTIDFLKEKLTAKYNYTKTGCSSKRGKGDMARYYFHKNDGLQNQYVLMTQTSLDAPAEVFFDPNALAADGTKSLGPAAFSESGRYWVYGISASGSDWQTLYVKDVQTKENLGDKIEWVKFSGMSWLHDDSGFFYSRYPEPKSMAGASDDVEGDEVKRGSETESNLNMAVYFHKIGTPQSEDKKIFGMSENPKWLFGAEVTDCGEYVIISVSESTAPVNRVFLFKVSDLLKKSDASMMDVEKLIDNFDAGYDYITNTGTKFYFKTNKDAPKYKVIAIDISKPEPENWMDVLPHKEEVTILTVVVPPMPRKMKEPHFSGDTSSNRRLTTSQVLEDLSCVAEKYLVTVYMQHARETLSIYNLDGTFVQEVKLPDVGSVASLAARKSDKEFFYSFSGFVHPGIKFRFDMEKMESTKLREDIVADHNPEDFETKQVFYPSKDGTMIPMFIVGRKNQQLTGDACTLLYGYGGFSISITPSFSPFRTVFIKHFNGLLCVANIRGGGEYGEDWHQAGIKLKKQNSYDDFQAAAEYLIREKYTNSSKITINGGSNGGLLVGACVNQRPDLFACAVPQVGVMDMLKFHKFTIGYAWCADFGCSEESEEEFKNLYGISPLHNINPDKGQYPAVLVCTADHDDRVVPLHSLKYAATLQYAFEGKDFQKNPLLIRVETKAGHGAGKPTSKVIEEVADIYGFIGHVTGTECLKDV